MLLIGCCLCMFIHSCWLATLVGWFVANFEFDCFVGVLVDWFVVGCILLLGWWCVCFGG